MALFAIVTTTPIWSAAEPGRAAKQSNAKIYVQTFIKPGKKNPVEWYHNSSFAIIPVKNRELIVTNKGVFRPVNGLPANAEAAYHFFPFDQEGNPGQLERNTTYRLDMGKNMRNPRMEKIQ